MQCTVITLDLPNLAVLRLRLLEVDKPNIVNPQFRTLLAERPNLIDQHFHPPLDRTRFVDQHLTG